MGKRRLEPTPPESDLLARWGWRAGGAGWSLLCGSLSTHTNARGPDAERGGRHSGRGLAGLQPPRGRIAQAERSDRDERGGARASPAARTREEDEAALAHLRPCSSAPPPSVTSGRVEPRRKRADRVASPWRPVIAEPAAGGRRPGVGGRVWGRAPSRLAWGSGAAAAWAWAAPGLEVGPPAALFCFPGLAHLCTRCAGCGISPEAPVRAVGPSFCGVVCLSLVVSLRSAHGTVSASGVCSKYRRPWCL